MNTDTNYKVPLRILIQSEKNKNVSNIRKMYGQLGVDIFQDSKKASILNHKNKSKLQVYIDKVKNFLGINKKVDYEENDSLHKVMFKYLYNNKTGTEKDIETMFGQNGKEHFKAFKHLGYIRHF